MVGYRSVGASPLASRESSPSSGAQRRRGLRGLHERGRNVQDLLPRIRSAFPDANRQQLLKSQLLSRRVVNPELRREMDEQLLRATEQFDETKEGDLARIETYLLEGANPNVTNIEFENGLHHRDPDWPLSKTALMIAAKAGHENLVTKLLLAKANPNLTNKNGRTPLMYSAKSGRLGVVRTLLLARSDPNITTHNGQTALMFASRNESTSVIDILLKQGANPNCRTTTGWTASMLCAKYQRHENLARLLRGHGDSNMVADGGWTALLFCAKYGSREMIKTLLQHGAIVNKQNSHGWTALMLAIKYSSEECVDVLLSHGGDPNLLSKNGLSSVHICAKYRKPQSLRRILAKPGPYVKKARFDLSRLFIAEFDFPKVLAELIAKFTIANADIDLLDYHGCTALQTAQESARALLPLEEATDETIIKWTQWREVVELLKPIASLDINWSPTPPVRDGSAELEAVYWAEPRW